MDKNSLIRTLSSMKIPKDSYSIDSIENESLCLIKDGILWSVFYSERGQRSGEEHFNQEEAACKAFLQRLKKMLGLK
ncbi:hypothetical protein EAE91_22995 [Photorhabdus noenieputensis]|uniref:hypothetical protein n=2 Tax=Photorhabdus TaxID=29487 RepID=UPI00311AC92F|nr:hypothetical protein [Photorhabdus noenieputensis]